MDTTSAINQAVPETDTLTCRQNPTGRHKRSPAQMAVSLQNMAKMTGRPRRVEVDWRAYMCFGLDGSPDTVIAKALGISVRTFKRRKAERQRQADSLWRDD
jgi:hypothetical protein